MILVRTNSGKAARLQNSVTATLPVQLTAYLRLL